MTGEPEEGSQRMKVILVNGSPNKAGCTYTALCEIEKVLAEEGIDTEIFHIGTQPLAGCIGCGVCRETKRCFRDDSVNKFVELAEEADGFIFGSPVHFASAAGAITSFMDRVFYGKKDIFRNKPAAAVVSLRRGGATASMDQLNKYFSISCMPIVSSQYWNMVHGNKPEEVLKDLEGLQTMRTLGRNMAWLLKSIEYGKKAGLSLPVQEAPVATNFIR